MPRYIDHERKLYGITLGEVESFIEEDVMNGTGKIRAFKMSNLIKL